MRFAKELKHPFTEEREWCGITSESSGISSPCSERSSWIKYGRTRKTRTQSCIGGNL